MLERYKESINHLHRAEQVIPLGAQTFSKSKAQFNVGTAPLYAARAKGAYLWDVDGNRYVDLISNLAAVTLGYSHKGQNKEVVRQLRNSTGMSLPSKIEAEVAEKIVELVPSAEMVRFAKNGTDATSAAIRLSRAYTGREHVVVCGYHGWQDWYIGSTNRNKGVPNSSRRLTHSFQFNDLVELRRLFDEFKGEIACVILEPMNRVFPEPGFLQTVISICEAEGAICVFDETITGFRFAKGGAQELFEVTPHLSTFGKGIANGFPLSVISGRRDIMIEMENIFFSGTFGGELLSLVAANFVLDEHLKDSICPQLASAGDDLCSEMRRIVLGAGLGDVLSFTGHPSWIFYEWTESHGFSASEIKSYFLQEMYRNGILLLGTNNVTLSHNRRVLKKITNVFEVVIDSVQESLLNGTLTQKLLSAPLEPVLKIR